MYEYKFIKVDVGMLNGKPKENYHELIHQSAKEDWRLAHVIAPCFGGNGQALYMELIFEREIK